MPQQLHPRRIPRPRPRRNPAHGHIDPIRRRPAHHPRHHHRLRFRPRDHELAPNSRCNSASRASASRGVSPSTSTAAIRSTILCDSGVNIVICIAPPAGSSALRHLLRLRPLMQLQHLPRPRNHPRRQPRQPRHLDPVALARRPRLHRMQKHDPARRLLHRHPQVLQPRQPLRQQSQLVVVRRKQCPRPDPLMQMLHRRPRQRKPIVCRSSTPHLIQQHQASRRRRVQNRRRLRHLHHKRRPPPRHIVARPNPRIDPVHQPQPHPLRRHKTPRTAPSPPAAPPAADTYSCPPYSAP